jgi:hypothetical protein
VIWKDTVTGTVVDGVFVGGVEYTAEVNLTPAIGYTFRGVVQNGFIHTGAVGVQNSADSGEITIGFQGASIVGGPTIVYDTDLTGRIHRPISGESPVRSIAGSQYTGTITWMPAPHGTFEYDTAYTATLNLTAVSGYTFVGIGENAFIHGDGGVSNPADSGVVRIIFPPTVSYTYTAITSFGPVGAEGSALKMMWEKRNDNSLTIDLPEGPEPVDPDSVTLVAGDTSPAKVIINGHNRVLSIEGPGTLLTVGAGVTLTLRNITLWGYDTNDAPLVTVAHGGKLILGTGVTLAGNKTSGDAGGVWVNGGELVLNNGAVIKGMEARRGGGVLIDAYGKLSMNGGTIGGELSAEGNTVFGENGGGGVLVLDGSFDMTGGTIQLNSAASQSSGGGVAVLPDGTFNLYSGIIKGNSALWPSPGMDAESGGAVFLIGNNNYPYDIGRFNMYGGTIGGENSGDANTAILGANSVCVIRGRFTMAGGAITGNTGASNYSVYIVPTDTYDVKTFMMRGAAKIDKDDKVFLSANAKITIGGALSASPAANIIHESPVSGTTYLLEAGSSGLMMGNIDKFLYDDGVDRYIVPFNDGWDTTWYGVYQE